MAWFCYLLSWGGVCREDLITTVQMGLGWSQGQAGGLADHLCGVSPLLLPFFLVLEPHHHCVCSKGEPQRETGQGV